MAAGAALPGLFLCFAAMVLLIIVSVSVPIWKDVSFLDVVVGGGTATSFGVFGYTGSGMAKVGYTITENLVGYSSPSLENGILHNLTYVLVLYPVAAGLAGLAFIFGLFGASYHRAGTVFMTLLSGLAALVATVAWPVSMALFSVIRKQVNDNGDVATYGKALWFGVAAMVALYLAFLTSACGVCGHYRKRYDDY